DPLPRGAAENPLHEQPAGTIPFGPDVFRERRARLMAAMKGGVAIVPSAEHVDWESDARQDSGVLYLTGLAREGAAALVLAPQDDIKEHLFLHPVSPESDRWTGYRTLIPSRELEQRIGISRIRRTDRLGATLASLAYRYHDLHFLGPLVGFDAEA